MIQRFLVHWLIVAKLSPEEARERVPLARERASRYPRPLNWVYPLFVLWVEWLFPLLFLRRCCRASSLTGEDFERLEQKLHHHRWLWPRMMYMMVRLPLWDQLAPEEQPVTKRQAHPLIGKLSSPPKTTDFDIIVIGSGAGGAPLSWELSRQGLRVAVVEAGGLTQPQTTATTIERYFLQQGFILSVQGGTVMPVLAGSTVGGTTSINSGTCLRPAQEKLRQWDEEAGTHLGQGQLLPYLETVEKCLGVTIAPKTLLSPSAWLFEEGLTRLGRSGAYVLPRNAPGCEGRGRCCWGCPTGAKHSTDLAFLPQALDHGCTLLAPWRATEIREEANGVRVKIRQDGQSHWLHGRKLVLAAGALQTPGLIRRNQLGTHWRQAGLHLRIHPACKVFAYFAQPVHSEQGVPQGLGYSPPELPRILLEGIDTPKASVGPMFSAAGQRHRWWLERYDHLAAFGFLVSERGEGRVWQVDNWPVVWHQMTAEDLADCVAALRLCAQAFFAAGAQRILLPVVGMINEVESCEQLETIFQQGVRRSHLMLGGFHPQGTAGIGRVVDEHLALLGTKHLHVCDASVLPGSPGVNPQIIIMGLSLYLADYMKQHWNS